MANHLKQAAIRRMSDSQEQEQIMNLMWWVWIACMCVKMKDMAQGQLLMLEQGMHNLWLAVRKILLLTLPSNGISHPIEDSSASPKEHLAVIIWPFSKKY